MELTDSLKALFIDTAYSLKGSSRRLFMARTVKELGPECLKALPATLMVVSGCVVREEAVGNLGQSFCGSACFSGSAKRTRMMGSYAKIVSFLTSLRGIVISFRVSLLR